MNIILLILLGLAALVGAAGLIHALCGFNQGPDHFEPYHDISTD